MLIFTPQLNATEVTAHGGSCPLPAARNAADPRDKAGQRSATDTSGVAGSAADLGAGEFDFTVPDALSASAPAEARGVPRDGVRMLVGRRSGLKLDHRVAAELPDVLKPGDLLVVNNSGTIPAALTATLPDGAEVVLHISSAQPRPSQPRTRATEGAPWDGLSSTASVDGTQHHHGAYGAGEYLIELRRPHHGSSVPYPADASPAAPGLVLSLPGPASAVLTSSFTPRLWYARFRLPLGEGAGLLAYLARHGRPIRYSYVERDWPLSAYQTVFATEPGSSEMPSAARPFTGELVARLAARGVLIAPITLHTGVASPEAHELPYAERFRVPETTARLVNHVRDGGGRVVAVGTTAVRALESAIGPDGRVRATEGWTELVVTPDRPLHAVDGLLTGWHEPRASHLMMLQAVAGRPLLDLCYAEAVRAGYRWHEFGDVNLLLP